MKLKALLILVLMCTVPLHAVTDLDEWSSNKCKRIGTGLCAMALAASVYVVITDGLHPEDKINWRGQHYKDYKAINSFCGFIACGLVHGGMLLIYGLLGWGGDENKTE